MQQHMVGKITAFRQRHTQAGVCTFLLELLLGVTVLPLVKGTRPAVAILGLELVTGLTTRYATVSCRAKTCGQHTCAESAAGVMCEVETQESCNLMSDHLVRRTASLKFRKACSHNSTVCLCFVVAIAVNRSRGDRDRITKQRCCRRLQFDLP